MLFEPDKALALTPHPCAVLVEGRAEGVLIGGNVALLAAQVGTPDSRRRGRRIAVLEEIGEEPYRLDRMLTQLLRSGWFDGVRGIVVGQLTAAAPRTGSTPCCVDRLAPLGVPLLTGAPFGHEPPNLAFPCGVPAELDATDAAPGGTLTLRAPALL